MEGDTLARSKVWSLLCAIFKRGIFGHSLFIVHCFTTFALRKGKFAICRTMLCRIDRIRHSYDVLFQKPSNVEFMAGQCLHAEIELPYFTNLVSGWSVKLDL